jgi:hypothetical protein
MLLRTSLVDRAMASSPTCWQPAPAPSNGPLALEDANALVVSLDADRTMFRYYQLLADFLRLELRRTLAREVPDLHRRAARWFAITETSPRRCDIRSRPAIGRGRRGRSPTICSVWRSTPTKRRSPRCCERSSRVCSPIILSSRWLTRRRCGHRAGSRTRPLSWSWRSPASSARRRHGATSRGDRGRTLGARSAQLATHGGHRAGDASRRVDQGRRRDRCRYRTRTSPSSDAMARTRIVGRRTVTSHRWIPVIQRAGTTTVVARAACGT